MSVKTSRGRTGPRNRTCVGRDCPNRSTSPGPEKLAVGVAVPTATVCPSADTDCSVDTAGGLASLSLADDLARLLVVAEAEVSGMSKLPVTGPFAEADLRHEFGPDPVDALARDALDIGERRRRSLQPRQLRRQPVEL